MKRLLPTCLLLGALTTIQKSAHAQNWQLVWQDEFTNGISADWNFETGNGGGGWGNNELEYYRRENATVENGQLVITAKRESFGGFNYTSARMTTQGKKSWKFGKIEARIKMPPGRGLYPCFWLNSDYDENGSLSWPPEIDILEYAPNGVTEFPNFVHSNVALSIPNAQGGQWLYRDSNFNSQWKFYRAPVDMTDDWHVYGMLWDTDDTVTAYLDGKKLWKRTYRWVYKDGRTAGPAHILINLAVGGDWAGAGGIDNSAFPASLQVSYVRVCQRATTGRGEATCAGSQLAPH